MLKIDDIKVNYGHFQALHGVSLEINKGEIIALLGGNGAGKTTTINAISGMLELRSGDIQFESKSIKDIQAHERVKAGIVQVPEGRKLFPGMSVYENLLIGSYVPEARAKRKEQLEKCFSIFPRLAERRSQMAGSLSGGEQQMCAIARGLMSQPKLLMLDEPSLGLAPVMVDTIFKTIVEINKMGVTILLVEQNVLISLEIASRAYVIEVGANVLDGFSEELMHCEEVRKAYLGI